MSFLDRIRDNDEQEVELNPSTVHDSEPGREQRGGEVELQDEEQNDSSSSNGFLPGMGETDSSSGRSAGSRAAGSSGDDRLAKIMEQNERIIELLEQIAGSKDRSDRSGSSSSEELW